MERRSFLKGIFGAAVVAAIPKPVMEQIEKITPVPVLKADVNSIGQSSENCLYIYDKEKLIGYSFNFNIETKFDEPYPMNPQYIQHIYDPQTTHINVSNVHWTEEPQIDNRRFHVLIKHNNLEISTEVLIVELSKYGLIHERNVCDAELYVIENIIVQ